MPKTATRAAPTNGSGDVNDRTEHRRIMRAILMGKTPGRARQIARSKVPGVTIDRIKRDTQALQDADVGPETRLLTVNQVAVILGVIPRRVRLLCQDGRLGNQIGGGPWIIERAELIEYLSREHSSGQAGRKAAERDKAMTAERHGSVQ